MANWTNYKITALKALESEDYEEAERQWQSALKEAERFGQKDGRYALSVDNLALTHHHLGRPQKAEPLYKLAVMIREASLSPNHKDVATSYSNLATVQFKQGKYTDAERSYKKALEIREEACGKNSKEVGSVLYQLGMVFHAQKKYPQAEDFYKRALEIKNKVFGPDHIELVHILKNFAHLLRKTGRESTADQMANFAKTIEEKNA